MSTLMFIPRWVVCCLPQPTLFTPFPGAPPIPQNVPHSASMPFTLGGNQAPPYPQPIAAPSFA
ncbi:hypothetical protein CCACVL1_19061 [Corchorus capsularis]|uniref:Uncharacterized protein n=1 Tax=Corchorus capsularis TaxID=210143 RepID=A0A1R3HIQ0_COCAP|nr:hypothetical protein CCACVL1_19061 [Corchorus capsularis]